MSVLWFHVRPSSEIARGIDGGKRALARTTILFFLFAVVMVFGMSMSKDLDVDESPFIASGALMARHGDLPYRDYHYNHMPTEVIVYAGLFRLSDHLLLTARAFQSLCAAALTAVLFAVAYGSATQFSRRGRLLLAWGIGLLLLTNPIFTRTAGISWNHDFPMLMAMLGFLAVRAGLNRENGAIAVAVGGLLVGIAATSRLTFLPITAGFVLLILLRRRGAGALLLIGWFAIGFAIACLPSLWIWSRSWQNAFFGNFLYPRLNTAIHLRRDGHPHAKFISILGWYLKSLVTLPGNGIVTVAFFVLAMSRFRTMGRKLDAFRADLLAICVIVILLLASGFMPAPPYPQYFYAATPFMILGIALCLANWPELAREPVAWIIPGAILAVCFFAGIVAYGHVYRLATPRRWIPMRVHAIGRQLAPRLQGGYVLTLEPVFPLEGGLDVHPWFTTGRFGLRAASLLNEEQRRQYLMPNISEIPALFDQNPQGSVLIVRGSDARGERALIAAAVAHGYHPLDLSLRSGGRKHPWIVAYVPTGNGHVRSVSFPTDADSAVQTDDRLPRDAISRLAGAAGDGDVDRRAASKGHGIPTVQESIARALTAVVRHSV